MTPRELRAIRLKHKLTQRAMGALLGVNAKSLSRLERPPADRAGKAIPAGVANMARAIQLHPDLIDQLAN